MLDNGLDSAERTPLLQHTNSNTSHHRVATKSWQTPENLTLVVLIIVLLASLGDQLQESPQTRITEAVICYHYWEKVDPSKLLLGRENVGPGAIGGVEEMFCKVADVQGELAMLGGWQALFDGLPNLLLGLPAGWVADRYGRKPVVLAGLLAFALKALWTELVTWFWQAFDIRMIWLSSLFGSLGGGPAVTSMLCYVVLSDILPQARRSEAFLRVGAFTLVAQVLMPPLAAWLMTYNPWIPVLLGTLFLFLATASMIVVPETLRFHAQSSIQVSGPPSPNVEVVSVPSSPALNRKPIPLGLFPRWLAHAKESTGFLTNDWRVIVLILPFLVHMLLGTTSSLVLQYLSKRYELTLSKATLILTVRSSVTALLLFIILPYISTHLVHKFGLSTQRKDLYITQISQVFVAVGWILVGLSPNITSVVIGLAINSLGQGAPLLLRSFIASLLPTHHVARVFSVISVVDVLGTMIGSPLLAELFRRGLETGWFGLVFLVAGFVSFLFLLLLLSVRLRKGEDGHVADTAEL